MDEHLAVALVERREAAEGRVAALNVRAVVSGDGATSPETTAAARRASPARRPADRRRFRASFATIRSSHGRKGDPSRNRPSAR